MRGHSVGVGGGAMRIEIVKEPYLKQLRAETTALKRIFDGRT
jgi:hypothetical protein